VMPTKMVGKYVKPKDWNALISDPDTVVIDVRNMYEIRIGKFKRAVDPCTNSFREFPTWVDDQFELVESDTRESGVNNGNGIGQPAEDLNASKSKQLPRVALVVSDVRRHLAFFSARALKRFIIWKVGY